jgi:hypothetical protein
VTAPALRVLRLGGPKVRRALVAGALVVGIASLGSGTSYAVQFINSAPIELPGPGPGVPGPTPSSLYPSNIVVSGLTGTVTDVNVTLNGLDCSSRGPDFAYPEDVDILLVGPTGANAVIFSDVGGQNQTTALQFPAINVTLDDQAANPLPADTQLAAGTYRPVDDDNDPDEQPNAVGVDNFPPPAPAPSGNTALATFNGTDPNGTWSLYVVDDYPGPNNCRIAGGWTLDILTSGPTTTSGGPTTTGGGPTTTNGGPTTTAQVTTTTAQVTTTTAQVTTTTSAPTTTTSTSTSTSTSTTVAPTTTTSTTVPVPVPATCDGLTATILGTAGPDTITGTAGNDVISAGTGNDSVDGGGGDDVICGGAGNDRLRGNDGNDRLFGDAGVDQLFGDAGNDTLNGGADPDQCYRGPGDTTATCEQIVPVAV